MNQLTRRKHQRCAEDTAITYTFLNKTEQYEATARNRSRFGLYFETYKSVAPGTLIVIRRISPNVEQTQNAQSGETLDMNSPAKACRELNIQVVGEVKRCVKLDEASKPRYGVSVRYISPAN